MKTEKVKGFNDFTGEEALKRAEIKKVLAETFEKYGFQPAETPIIEYEEFVKGRNNRDEAISDVFTLKDKGKRNLALRYEFTFQLKRIAKNKKLPYRRYQIGEVFRDEPASSNRFRQFTQADVDVIGSTIRDEAEVIAMTDGILKKLGIEPIIWVNNRKLLNDILDKLKVKNKEKAIIEFDKKDKLPKNILKENLEKCGAGKLLGILRQNPEYFRKKYKSFSEIEELMDYCEVYGIKVKFAPYLVRGLSYYNGNVFEIKTKSMKETVCAGGSYEIDGVKSMGISFGLERLTMISSIKTEKENYLVVSLNQDKKSIEIAQKLRKKGKGCMIYYGKPSKALDYANSYNIEKVIFVGEKEVKSKKFKVKNMKTGKEESKTEKELL